jgi:hypothetical protein
MTHTLLAACFLLTVVFIWAVGLGYGFLTHFATTNAQQDTPSHQAVHLNESIVIPIKPNPSEDPPKPVAA